MIQRSADRLRMIAGGGYWYLGTPYTLHPHGLGIAADQAARASAHLFQKQVPHFCPITMCHAAAHAVEDLDPKNGQAWASRMAPFVRDAMGLIVVRLEGWEKSRGLRGEINEFKAASKPVVHLSWPIMEIVE